MIEATKSKGVHNEYFVNSDGILTQLVFGTHAEG